MSIYATAEGRNVCLTGAPPHARKGNADATAERQFRKEKKMTSPYVVETHNGGFNFENCFRNSQLQASSAQEIKIKAKKTGTTIAGMIFKDGVVLGADTRATSGEVIADKNCSKIHYIAPNIYCCGAGTAADTRKTTDMLRSNLTLQILSMGRNPRLVMACRILQDFLYRHRGQISAMLLLGGVDCTGPHIFTVGPYGSVNKAPFETMGSGDLPALAVFEDRFKPNMSYIRPFESSNYKAERLGKYKYDKGTTPVVSEQTTKLQVDLVEETVQQMEVV
ncbi:hypothetical protein JZ751_010688 [Albula glossodonta]|uniref:Proteasome subunit beta n=1 Tax=Albula glossodonta TaxID=121402 RepID=A0A8T2N7B2_9TELE|nr:hypothetical protein JZ751_010688 [Albula glossodonta]